MDIDNRPEELKLIQEVCDKTSFCSSTYHALSILCKEYVKLLKKEVDRFKTDKNISTELVEWDERWPAGKECSEAERVMADMELQNIIDKAKTYE